jgi:hypothetical protein
MELSNELRTKPYQEKLIYADRLGGGMIGDQKSLLEAITESKRGVWVYLPPSFTAFQKTIYFDRHENVLHRDYSCVDLPQLAVLIEASSIKAIENFGFVNIDRSECVIEVNQSCISTDVETGSVSIMMPMINFRPDPYGLNRNLPFPKQFHTNKILFAFTKFGPGEKNPDKNNRIEELAFRVSVEDLMILERDSNFIGMGRSDDDKKIYTLISNEWMSKCLKTLNIIHSKYLKYDEIADQKMKSTIEERIREDLSKSLLISNRQKLDTAFQIVSGKGSWYRRGIFGESTANKITLLEIINRLAEVHYDANEGKERQQYVSGSNDESSIPLKNIDELFRLRVKDSANFTNWVENELSVFALNKWAARCKHVSEFIRN